jgi:hypothetical protein
VDVRKWKLLAAAIAIVTGIAAGLASRSEALPSYGYRTNFYDRPANQPGKVLVGWQRLHCTGGFSSWGTATEYEYTAEWECDHLDNGN